MAVFNGDIEIVVKDLDGQRAQLTIELRDEQIAELFAEAFDGWCPVCLNRRVNEGETVCCDCAREAQDYHTLHCGCLKEAA